MHSLHLSALWLTSHVPGQASKGNVTFSLFEFGMNPALFLAFIDLTCVSHSLLDALNSTGTRRDSYPRLFAVAIRTGGRPNVLIPVCENCTIGPMKLFISFL